MKRVSAIIGKACEDTAESLLKKRGYKILQRNFRTKLGELDIVARDKDTICFVEVKGRRNLTRGLPQEMINRFKKRKICQSALLFLKQNNLLNAKARFDVVTIDLNQGEAKLFKNAFELEGRYSY